MPKPAHGDLIGNFIEACAGGAGGACSSFTLFPLDLAKSHKLTKTGKKHLKETTWSTLCKIYKKNGPLGLYQGVWSKITHQMVMQFTFFYIYSNFKHFVKSSLGMKLTPTSNLLVGYLSGCGTIAFSTPFEVVSLRQQLAAKPKPGYFETFKGIIATQGVTGLWKGFFSNVVLACNPAIVYTVFDQLKKRYLTHLNRAGGNVTALSALQAFTIGCIAKIVATMLTFPLIRAKNLQQKEKKKAASGESKAEPKENEMPANVTLMGVFRHVIKQEGWGGLYKGVEAQAFRVMLKEAFMLMYKERIQFYTRVFVGRLLGRAL